MYSAFPGQFSPIPGSFQVISLDNSEATSLAVPSGEGVGLAKYALIQALTADVAWRDDGIDPTPDAEGGMSLLKDQPPIGFLGNLNTIKFISKDSGGSKLLVSYYS